MTDTQNFPFRFELGYRHAARLFGVTEGSTSITISEDVLRVRFGSWRVRTPLSNIKLERRRKRQMFRAAWDAK